ncbi:hypothetical protein GPECTOR_35g935 [Gonium pectorale]|uniref:phytol kinase n=1 Tax=Gonium pectorale TaxID=33097 RepID=A0A150GCC3_GONPE|nr:hypothetical protein GPECTOR_35g935 [Gonium pectorale]|eukprot:KXZ47497.1 hypothetical protein GPECTOR_35g935 [Gonium pectorale]
MLLVLFRSQALHAAGRQLAALTESLDETEVARAWLEARGGPTTPSSPAAYTLDVLAFASLPIQLACQICHDSDLREPPELCEELVAALEGSQVLEHAGRALVLLLTRLRGLCARPGQGLTALEYVTSNAALTLTELKILYDEYAAKDEDGGNGPSFKQLAERLRLTASGACARHAALCLGLAVLCDADGGPAYGMPPELLAALPKDDAESNTGRRMCRLATWRLMGIPDMLHLEKAPPPGRHAALALLMRVGWLAVASARELTSGVRGVSPQSGGAASGTGTGAGSGSPRGHVPAGTLRRVVREELVYMVGHRSLTGAFFLLPSLPDGTPEAVSRAAAATQDWWQLAVGVATHLLPYSAAGSQLPVLGKVLHLSQSRGLAYCGALSLPAVPPPAVAAALTAGLLPCLERLMRGAGRDPRGPEATVLRNLACADDPAETTGFWPYLAPLLAYGDPRQAAALLATLSKLLRTVDPQAFFGDPWVPEHDTHHCFLSAAASVVVALCENPETGPDAAAAAAGPDAAAAVDGPPLSHASQQLGRLLSFAACQLLPELSRTILKAIQLPMVGHTLYPGPLLRLLRCIPPLADRCTPRAPARSGSGHETGHETGHEAGADGGKDGGENNVGVVVTDGIVPAGGPDDGGWRALLLEGLGAVPLLDALVRVVPRTSGATIEGRSFLRLTIAGCCAVAEVAMGLVWPVSEAAAGPSGQPHPYGGLAAAAAAGNDVSEAAPVWESTPTTVTSALGAAAPAGPSDASRAGSRTPSPLPWRPELLRRAAAELRACGEPDVASDAEGLAVYLEGAGGGGFEGLWRPRLEAESLASALPPPAEARRLLPSRCANPTCANLEGDSEADLALKACARCGSVGYCCRPCQLEHWRAGHKGACGRERGEGAKGGEP